MLDLVRQKLAAMRAAPAPVDQILEEIDEVREQVARMQAERAAVAAAPRPPEEIIGLLDDHLSALAADTVDALAVSHMLAPGAGVAIQLSTSGDPRTETARLLGLIVLLNRTTLKKLLVAQVEQAASASPVPPLTESQRAERLTELDAAILSAELAEEAAIRKLEAVGISVMRRGDANPLAVLADDNALPA